jgi:hypothetical protein
MTVQETTIASTLHDHRSPADVCRARGWSVGTQLVGDEGAGPTVIQITAIGERCILARTLSHNGRRATYRDEGLWSLDCRDWQEREHG